ncbi:MAG: hypothetical protein A2234_00055 [Elusimicrobia bacterium RIFOXYA2_FULL_58_8]|nr:MAG: hypothetical protein A2234_00055 [Elusimicrobia bacterium RIFOXYA2_FULL_58_8]
MPVDMAELASRARGFIGAAMDNVLVIYAEKGMEPFKKPLTISVSLLLAIYVAVYRPLNARIGDTAFKLRNLHAIATGAGEYADAKKRLMEYQSKLPLLKDKDDWLNYLLMSTARAHAITYDVLSAQKEESAGNFIIVSRDVEFLATYDALGKWLEDIENSPISLRVVSISALRDRDNPVNAKVSAKVLTLFIKAGQDTLASGGTPK